LALALSGLLCCGAAAQDDGERLPPPPGTVSDEPVFMAKQLAEACQPAATADAAAKAAGAKVCDSYLRGLADGLYMVGALEGSRIQLCIPHDGPLALEDVRSDFEKYVAAHPEALDHAAALVGAFAVVAANPCADEAMRRDELQE
jgi:hypothetical protein